MIRVDGNIGAGKSTLIALLSKHLPNIKVVPEPVKHWQAITDSDGVNILKAFYDDPKKFACLFQIFAFITRLQELHDAYEAKGSANVEAWISERSIHSDMNIFAKNAYENQFMTELEYKLYEDIYNRWQALFSLKTKADYTIYIRTTPEICLQRIKSRSRDEEKDTIDIGYLRQIHERHEEWLKDQENVIIIDGDKEYIKDESSILEIVNKIKEKIAAKKAPYFEPTIYSECR